MQAHREQSQTRSSSAAEVDIGPPKAIPLSMITELKVFTTGLAGLPVWIGTPTVGCRAVKALLTIDAQAGDSILSDYIQRVFPETECAIPIDWNPEVRWTV